MATEKHGPPHGSHLGCLCCHADSGGPWPVKPKPKPSLISRAVMLFGSSEFYLLQEENPKGDMHLKMCFCLADWLCPESRLLQL